MLRSLKPILLPLTAWLLLILPVTAQASVLIDFNQFSNGATASDINLVTSQYGITFDAGLGLSVAGGADKFISANTYPPGADILINFASPVVSVTFDHLSYNGNTKTFDFTGTITNINYPAPYLEYVTNPVPGPVTVSGSDILSMVVESLGGTVAMDNLLVTFAYEVNDASEPQTMWILGVGLLLILVGKHGRDIRSSRSRLPRAA